MKVREVHHCQCEICQKPEPDPEKTIHHQMNVFMSRLDEQQRRWYAAIEAEKLGHGGTERVALITGLNINTIRRGRREMARELAGRPSGRTRLAGGGRKAVEKKSQPSRQPSRK